MKRLLVLTACLFLAIAARAQGTAAIQDHAYQGGVKAQVSGLSSTNYLYGIVPSATVTVYLTGTQTKATIFSDASGTALSNPFTANASNSVDPGGWIFWAAVNTGYDIVLSGGIPPNSYAQPVTLSDRYPSFSFSGGGTFPSVTEIVSGDGSGNGVGMPEKGTNIVSNQAFVAWDEDSQNANGGMGRFDCRDTKYGPGGCLGGNSAQAMVDLFTDMACYQHTTGKHASTLLPPGRITVGTPSQPTLIIPTGVYIRGAGGEGGAADSAGTTLVGHYNNTDTADVNLNTTSTCNGSTITNTLTQGSYERFAVTGCAQGGCTNMPGDSNSHPEGGPLNRGLYITDGAYWADQLSSYATGADGIIFDGLDGRIGTALAATHDFYFYSGMDQSGQNYVFSSGELHAGIYLKCGDCTFVGPYETYGTFMTLGPEYGRIAGVIWGGGTTYAGPVFSQIEEIGLIRPFGFVGGRNVGDRIDGPRGDGIRAGSGEDVFASPTITSPCIANPANTYYVSAAAILTGGSAQTDGTYLLNASSGAAQISVTVSGGVATAAVVKTNGRGYTSTPPTFTLAAGGTPGTFTITMQNVFIGAAAPTITCAGIYDAAGPGFDVYNAPVVLNQQPVFGVSNATADFYTPTSTSTWIAPTGTGPNASPRFGQINSEVAGQAQRMILPDIIKTGGGTPTSGSAIDMRATGTHVKLINTTATTISVFNNALMMQDIWLYGDGFTTMPSSIATNCSAHDLLLISGQWYHYFVSGGQFFTPPTLTEQCDPPNDDYRFTGLAGLSSPPALDATAVNHTAGTVGVTRLQNLANGTLTFAGTPSSFQYCFIREVIIGGAAMTDTPQCTAKTPIATNISTDNLAYHAAIPLNWTEYRVIFQSTTDSSFTASLGTIKDVAATLPQPAIADIGLGVVTGILSGDAVNIASQDQGINLTGTYSFDLTITPPTQTAVFCTPGQFIPNISSGFDYMCDSSNHWVRRAANAWATF